jgi:hypothetical protein
MGFEKRALQVNPQLKEKAIALNFTANNFFFLSQHTWTPRSDCRSILYSVFYDFFLAKTHFQPNQAIGK